MLKFFFDKMPNLDKPENLRTEWIDYYLVRA